MDTVCCFGIFILDLRMLISLSVELVRIAFLLFGFPGNHNSQNVLETETSLCAFDFMEAHPMGLTYRIDTAILWNR